MVTFKIGLVVIGIALFPALAFSAGPVVSISSSAEMNALKVGQPFSLQVSVSGITGQTTFVDLFTVLSVDSTMFDYVPGLIGPIVPDDTGFEWTTPGGAFDATFAQFNHASLIENGLFYTYILTPKNIGAGSIDLFPVSSVGTDSDGNFEFNGTLSGAPLQFQVVPTTVPEPATLSIFGLMSIGLLQRRKLLI